MTVPNDVPARLAEDAARIEAELATWLTPEPAPGEIERPERLIIAMRYAVLNGGKRIRPFLVLATTRMLGGDEASALRVGAAIEMLHGYSLIHDDLPSMDDDDLRRGKPTLHRAFDEATAILAGDALQSLAFAILANPSTHPDPAVRSELVLGLALAVGAGGMVGGQMLDLAAEGRFAGDGAPVPLGDPDIRTLQAMKTGALLRFSIEAGAILSGTSDDARYQLTSFGETIGLAFQIADDLLDVSSSADRVGKATGKDGPRGKATLVGLHGVPAMEDALAEIIARSDRFLESFGAAADELRATARFIARRDH